MRAMLGHLRQVESDMNVAIVIQFESKAQDDNVGSRR
jgi:hypothetical protein